MSDQVSYQNLGGEGEFVEDAPILDKDAKKRSEERMQHMFASIAKKEGAVLEKLQSNQPESKDGQSPSGEAPQKSGENSEGNKQVQTSQASKPKATPPPTEASQTAPQGEPGDSSESADDSSGSESTRTINWEQESKKHQSRADQLDTKYKQVNSELENYRSQVEQLKSYETMVNEFKSNPVQYLANNFPDLITQFKNYADPVSAVEEEVGQYRKQLEEDFRKKFGADWEFDPNESLVPGKPSFRFRVAVEDKIAQARNRYHETVETARRRQEERRRETEEQKKRLKDEFNFTDEDLQSVEKFAKENPFNYYNLGRMALLDRIIEQRVNALLQNNQPPPDLATAPAPKQKKKKDQEISPEMRGLAARLGVGSFFKEQ